MATIRPFKALRPKKELSDKIAALPYDVYNREEAAKKVENDRYSFLRIDRPETQFPKDQDMYAPEVYKKAAEMLEEMQKEGSFVQDAKACYYIYELTMDGRSQTGLVAASAVDDYINNVIRKHENTRKEKEADRIRHVDTCNAQTGPIFLAYNSNPDVKKILEGIKEEKADVDFTADDGVRIVSDAGFLSGEKSLKIEKPADKGAGVSSNPLPVLPGKNAVVKFWAKSGNGTLNAYVIFDCFQGEQNRHLYKEIIFKLEPEWKEYSFEFAVPADVNEYTGLKEGTCRLRLGLRTSSETAEGFFDNVEYCVK